MLNSAQARELAQELASSSETHQGSDSTEDGSEEQEDDDREARTWKTDGVDLIINTFRFESSLYEASEPGRRERHDNSFMSVSSIGIRGYHGRKSFGFSIGMPFASGVLQVPESGAFHLGYQLDNNWQIGLLAFIDFSSKSYREDNSSSFDADEDENHYSDAVLDYGASNMSTALGGWIDWRVLEHWHLQFALYHVRSVVRSSVGRSYNSGHYQGDTEESDSGVEYTRLNLSIARHFKLSPKVEFAPKILVGINSFYDRDYRYRDNNGDVMDLNFENSNGFYFSVTLGSFIYHI